MNKLLLTSAVLAAAAGLAGAASLVWTDTNQQSLHAGQSAAVLQGNTLADQPVPVELAANATFGAAVEKALAEARSGQIQSVTDPAQRFHVTISSSAGTKSVRMVDVASNTLAGTWRVAGNASDAEIVTLLASVTDAAGLKAEAPRGVVSTLSDRQ